MFQVSDALAAQFSQPARHIRAKLMVEGVDHVLDEAVIESFKIEESCNSGQDLAVGSCCGSSAEIHLLNKDGALDGLTFINRTVKPFVGMEVDSPEEGSHLEWVPLGVFRVSEADYEEGFALTLRAQDDMQRFDRSCEVTVDGTDLTLQIPDGPQAVLNTETYTIGDMLLALGSLCGCGEAFLADSMYADDGVTWAFPNAAYQPKASFQGELSCRSLLTYLAQTAGSFARFDRNGKLEFAWYEDTQTSLNDGRYIAFGEKEYAIPAADTLRIEIKDGDLGRERGPGTHPYTISGNPLLYQLSAIEDDSWEPYADAILNRIKGLSYRPYSLSVQGNPLYQPGDIVSLYPSGAETPISIPIMTNTLTYNGGLSGEWTAIGSNPESNKAVGTVTESIRDLNKRYAGLEADLDSIVMTVENTKLSTDGRLEEAESSIRQTSESIESIVSKQVMVDGTLSELSTQLEQTAEGWSLDFNNLRSTVTDDSQKLQELTSRIRFQNGSIILSTGDDTIQAVLSHDRLSFMHGTNEVAYISDNHLYIEDARILEGLIIGKFMFQSRTNKNLSFKLAKEAK